VNDKVYIHEFIDIRGHHRADYMHHMTANWSPLAQETRHQLCYGVWALLGSTGAWPQTVNMWEEDGWEGLAESFGNEAVGAGAQDPALAKWWAKAADFRRGGFDRIVEPAPWTRTVEQLCADGVRGDVYAHELVKVRPGAARELLERAHEDAAPVLSDHGWELVGAFTTAMVDDDEAILLWSIPTWAQWGTAERAHHEDDRLVTWRSKVRDVVTAWHRVLLVDAPLSPLRLGRQPSRDDRTDWVD
jgi:hypothetical protein